MSAWAQESSYLFRSIELLDEQSELVEKANEAGVSADDLPEYVTVNNKIRILDEELAAICRQKADG